MVFIHLCKVEKIGFQKKTFERIKNFKIEATLLEKRDFQSFKKWKPKT